MSEAHKQTDGLQLPSTGLAVVAKNAERPGGFGQSPPLSCSRAATETERTRGTWSGWAAEGVSGADIILPGFSQI
jgi:hypothetical protein